MNKKKTFWRLLTLIQLIALLIISTYSWFVERTNPSIAENSIRVTSAEGLLIKLNPDSPGRTLINLN